MLRILIRIIESSSGNVETICAPTGNVYSQNKQTRNQKNEVQISLIVNKVYMFFELHFLSYK